MLPTKKQSQYRFRADSIQEAIQLAKEELGEDALILEVRRLASQDVQDGRQGDVEIVAMPEEVYRRQ
jgi:flagellar biosynthesis GTPase FlhF